MTARRHELTDEEWARLAPLLPPEKPQTGRSNNDHRPIVNAIQWHLGTGAPWRDRHVASDLQFVDGTVIPAHQHAARSKRGTPATEALGRSQRGLST